MQFFPKGSHSEATAWRNGLRKSNRHILCAHSIVRSTAVGISKWKLKQSGPLATCACFAAQLRPKMRATSKALWI